MRKKRQGLIVWYNHHRNIRDLRRYGHVIYTSKKQRYAVIYVDRDQINTIEEQLAKLPFVKQIERSQKPYIRTTFDKKDPIKIKDYDFHLGI